MRKLTARQRVTILDTVDKQLQYEPLVETQNRKPMRPNLLAPWELRIGSLRVYYHVEEAPDLMVYIRAVGIKKRNQVWIGGERFDL
ncbi:MAG: type II toxin-antitoxin system RelE/ParE family toxin [Caldilinea sp. CFX5]|nr:type II toxin-antitoxin system RelE/ParE family toxin [Caldilinea sp. CFX5]